MTATAARPIPPIVSKHAEALAEIRQALTDRSYYSRYPESPSPRVYGESAAADGLAAYESHLHSPYAAQLAAAGAETFVGSEVSPYGPTLGVSYPVFDVDAGLAAARAAIPGWRDAGALTRASVCLEIVDEINARSRSRTPSCTRPANRS